MEYDHISEVGKIKQVKSPCLSETIKFILSIMGSVIVGTWIVSAVYTKQKDIPQRVEKLEYEISSVKSDIVAVRTKTDMIYDLLSRQYQSKGAR